MKKITENILNTIEKEKIIPRSKKYFLVKNIFASLFTVVALFVSGIFSAGLVVSINNSMIIPRDFFILFLFVLVVFLGATLYVSYKLFMRVKKSHRASVRYVILLGLVVVFVIGFLGAHARLYSRIDSVARKHLPGISLQEEVEKSWSNPAEYNRLAVEIIYIDDDGYIYGQDFFKGFHVVDPLLLKKSEKEILLNYLTVRMNGEEIDGIFYPETVSPWRFRHKERNIHHDFNRPVIDGNIDFSKN